MAVRLRWAQVVSPPRPGEGAEPRASSRSAGVAASPRPRQCVDAGAFAGDVSESGSKTGCFKADLRVRLKRRGTVRGAFPVREVTFDRQTLPVVFGLDERAARRG
jgi:hypothetical protein